MNKRSSASSFWCQRGAQPKNIQKSKNNKVKKREIEEDEEVECSKTKLSKITIEATEYLKKRKIFENSTNAHTHLSSQNTIDNIVI